MNDDAIEFLVTSEEHNQRIDKVVSSKLSEFSRVLIKEWIESGNILVENQIVKPSTKLQEGQQINVVPVLKERSEIEPQKINLDIVFEDDDLIVVNGISISSILQLQHHRQIMQMQRLRLYHLQNKQMLEFDKLH